MTVVHILTVGESFEPFQRARTFVLARLGAFNCGAGDPRWAILAPALQVMHSAWAFGQRHLARWAMNVLRRAWLGARFAA